MQNGYGGIHILTAFPVLYRSFSHFSEQPPVLLDAELGFVDTLGIWPEMAMCSEQSQQKDSHRPDTTVSLTGTSLCIYAMEPTCTERYASLSNEACKNLEIAPVQTY